MYSELPRLLPTRSEKEGFTVLVVEGRRVLVNGRVNRNLLRPLLRFCGSFTAPSRPFTALFLSRPLRIFNGPFWAKGPWPQPLATLDPGQLWGAQLQQQKPALYEGGGGVVVLLTGRWLAREGHIQSAGSPVRRTGAQQRNEQGLEHN